MYCAKCGSQVSGAYQYCSKCGARIATSDSRHEPLPSYEAPLQATPPRRKKGHGLAWLIILIVFIFIGGIVYAGYSVVDFFIDAVDSFDSEDYGYNYSLDDDAAMVVNDSNNDGNSFGSIDIEDLDNANIAKETVPQLMLLLSFTDTEFTTSEDAWYNFMYDRGSYGYGSVNDYYMEMSKGNFAFEPAKETSGRENDGIISLSLNKKHPVFDGSRNVDDFYADGFVFYNEVISKADSYIDFSEYDTNGDSFLDPEELCIVLVFAGYEQYEDYDYSEYKNVSTYSCSTIYAGTAKADGMKMDECILTAELDPYIESGSQIMAKGIMCHELGHALGLPDLYDTDYSSTGLAFHALMAGGAENFTSSHMGTIPAPLSAWSKEFLGFIKPQQVSSDGTYQLHARSRENHNVIKIYEGSGYYLIENVDFEGYGQGLVTYASDAGIAIWYIDESVVNNEEIMYYNEINNDEDDLGVELMEAYDTHDLLKEEFDYYEYYDHYYRKSGDAEFVSAGGIKITILDNPKSTMEVLIEFP